MSWQAELRQLFDRLYDQCMQNVSAAPMKPEKGNGVCLLTAEKTAGADEVPVRVAFAVGDAAVEGLGRVLGTLANAFEDGSSDFLQSIRRD